MAPHPGDARPGDARPGNPGFASPDDIGMLATRMSLAAERYQHALARGEQGAASQNLLEVRSLLAAARSALRANRRSDSGTLGMILQCIRAGEAVLAGGRGALAG